MTRINAGIHPGFQTEDPDIISEIDHLIIIDGDKQTEVNRKPHDYTHDWFGIIETSLKFYKTPIWY